jgi:hypothetical protein
MMTRGRWHPAACLYPSMPNHGPPWASPPSPVHPFHPRAQLTPPAVKPRTPPCSPKRRGTARRKHLRSGSHGQRGAGRCRTEPSGRFLRTQIPARRCENPRGDGKVTGTRESRGTGVRGARRPSQPDGPEPTPAAGKAAAKSNQTYPTRRACSLWVSSHGGCPTPTQPHQPRARALAWSPGGRDERAASPKPYPYNIKPNPGL